jgi:hypothetical protein
MGVLLSKQSFFKNILSAWSRQSYFIFYSCLSICSNIRSMQKTYRGGLCALRPFYKGRGVPAEQQTPCGDLCELYAVPHPHAQEINIPNIEDVEKIEYCTQNRRTSSV